MYYCDIAIIGGGASALAAAIEAARGGAFVYILERLGRVGKKLLTTGNGRCNLSNTNARAESSLGNRELIAPVLASFSSVTDFFASLGLYTRALPSGHIYPMSNTASSVLDALRLECSRLGVAELCDFEAVSIGKGDHFIISDANGRKVQARRLIFAAGGKASPSLGTDGSAFRLLSRCGISITELSPALSPLRSSASELRSLKGLRVLADVKAHRRGHCLAESSGEVQFTDSALSGICVFDMAAYLPDQLSLDLMPDASHEELFEMLTHIVSCRADASLEDAFTGLFQKRISQCLIRRISTLPMNTPCSELSPSFLREFAAVIKNWDFPISTGDWDRAQATRGGIAAQEVTAELELKKLPGAYACGEALDVLGPCGGYNLHWAWASGRMAGSSALKGLI